MNWIDIKNQKPNDLDQVDVLINSKRRIVDCTFMNDGFYAFPPHAREQWTRINSNITHWMPLPAPPSND